RHRPAGARAAGSQRTEQAAGRSRLTQRRTEVHQRLVPVTCPSRRQKSAGPRSQVGPARGFAERVAANNAMRIGVHGQYILFEADAEQGTSRVVADSRECSQGVKIGRKLTPMAFHY